MGLRRDGAGEGMAGGKAKANYIRDKLNMSNFFFSD